MRCMFKSNPHPDLHPSRYTNTYAHRPTNNVILETCGARSGNTITGSCLRWALFTAQYASTWVSVQLQASEESTAVKGPGILYKTWWVQLSCDKNKTLVKSWFKYKINVIN